MSARIKKNDTVVIISGRDRGEQGIVVDIAPKKDKVMIKGLGLVTKHVKARRQGEVSSIKEKETFLPMSQVMPVCSACKKPSRVMVNRDGDKRARACSRCKKNM